MMLKGAAIPVATIASLYAIKYFFGAAVSVWCSIVVLAFCLGVFWGAGDQIRKHRESSTHQPKEPEHGQS